MPTRNTPFAPGTPCWVDLFSSDKEKSRAFYSELFGWTSLDAGEDYGSYTNFSSDGHKVAGMMANEPGSGVPDCWNTYLCTADIDATVAAATKAQAQLIVPAMPVGELGSMAVLIDPAGGPFGLWQPAGHTGFEKYNEPGSVTWNEYHSRDFATSSAFYSKLFGWTVEYTSDTDDFRYLTAHLGDGGDNVAGMMDSHTFLPPGAPSMWTVYFSVADVDTGVAKAVELGGELIRPAEDTPFGRLAELADSTGALFKLHQPPTGS